MAKRKPKLTAKQVRSRAAYRRRNERAQAAGFRNYYDQRVRRGRLDQPRPTGQLLRRARGHGTGKDLVKAARPGSIIVTLPTDRDQDGTYSKVYVHMIDAAGREQEFLLQGRQLKADYLRQLVRDLDAEGAIFSPSPYDLPSLSGTG
jgi:hypothetical protein